MFFVDIDVNVIVCLIVDCYMCGICVVYSLGFGNYDSVVDCRFKVDCIGGFINFICC